MEQGARGIIAKKMLSGIALIGLVLGFSVSQSHAWTDAYKVIPTSISNSGTASTVWESFTATCDTIDSVTVFVGAAQTNKNYTAQIIDSVGQNVIWSGTVSSNNKNYQDLGFGVHQAVTRGKKYQLQLGISSGTWNYFYDSSNPYPWGVMGGSGIVGGGNDLAARVIGKINPPDSVFWGENGEATGRKDSLITPVKDLGICLDREQFQWAWLEPKRDSFVWGGLDDYVQRAHNHGLRVMLDIYGTPVWASTAPDTIHHTNICSTDSTGPYWYYPPRNLNVSSPLDSNYLRKFLDTLARHYSAMGVHDYEVYNEVGYYTDWRYGLGRDILYYDINTYPHTPQGRAKLYATACSVAYYTVKAADPQAKIYTNAIGNINTPSDCEVISGKQWLQYFYDAGGKNYSDVITYHWYLCFDDPTYHGRSKKMFWSKQFIADYDTLRRVMRDNGDGAKTAWADEGGYGGHPAGVSSEYPYWSVGRDTQANIVVQAFVTGLGQRENGAGPAIGQVNWYKMLDRVDYPESLQYWFHWCGLVDSSPGFNYKPSAYAYKQMTGKLKNLNFNRRVQFTDTLVFCYEFQDTGAAGKKTWVVWRDTSPAVLETLGIRATQYDSIKIAYSATPAPGDSGGQTPFLSGKFPFWATTYPKYFRERGGIFCPDVIVDSMWTVPSNPKAGDSLWFYARIKNISTSAGVDSTLPDTVTFQVDGVSKARYQAKRGLGLPGSGKDTLTVGNSIATNPKDWQATYGDHLIRAWADSSACFVELRMDNNQKYLFEHMTPSGTIYIPGTGYPDGRKFTKVQPETLSLLSNGGTSPTASQMKIKNSWESSWRAWRNYATSWLDTLPSSLGLYKVQAEFKMASGETSAIAIDSIILDNNPPYANISSPVQNQVVSGTVPFKGNANDWYEHHLSQWEITLDASAWCSGTNEVGTLNPVQVAGTFGNWNSTQWPNGYYVHYLVVNDSAGNTSQYSVGINVSNAGGGNGFASGFGTLTSAPMNLVTDPQGNLIVAETQGSKIRKYSPRKDSLFAFSASRGDSTGLNWAVGMAMKDSITLYVADGYANGVKAFDTQGNLLLRFGSFGTNAGQFRQPCGIALDPKGRLWVSDRLNNRIQVFDSTGQFLFKFGSLGQDSGRFSSPTGITYVSKNTALGLTQDLVYISDTRNNQIQVFDSLGNYLKTVKAVDSLGLDTPLGICSDRLGDVFISDARHNRIVELTPYGDRILDFGGLGDSIGLFRTPVGVASSPGDHYLYVADMGNKRVQRFWVIQDSTGGGGPQSQGTVRLPPKEYFLSQSYPNPTTGEAMIDYGLPKESEVRLVIYNVAGQVVREYNLGKQKAWYYSIKWDGRSNLGHRVGAGVYFYRLNAGNWVKTRKMVVIR